MVYRSEAGYVMSEWRKPFSFPPMMRASQKGIPVRRGLSHGIKADLTFFPPQHHHDWHVTFHLSVTFFPLILISPEAGG